MGAATAFYRHFQRAEGLRELEFESTYAPREGPAPAMAGGEELRFTVSFVAPAGGQ
jgi:hypothetical protein